jgi:hypothetical protein
MTQSNIKLTDEQLELIEHYETMGYGYGPDAAEEAERCGVLEELGEWDPKDGLPSTEFLDEILSELFDAPFHEDDYLSMHDWYQEIPNEYNEAFFRGFKKAVRDFIKKKRGK